MDTPEITPAPTPRARRRRAHGLGSIYRRGGLYWIVYYHHGRRYRESSGSARKDDAAELLKARLARLGKGLPIDPGTERRVTMAQLFDALEQNYQINGQRLDTLKFRLAPLRDAFGPDRAIEVRAARIAEYTAARLKDGMAPASVNRELAALRRAFRLAVKMERIAAAPPIEMLAENNARQGFVNPGDFEAVVDALPDYLKDYARFGYLLGWRRGAIRNLDWSTIDRATQRIILPAKHSKNKRPVPISYAGVPGFAALIERRWQRREHTTPAGSAVSRFVFHRNGHQVKDFRGAWATACKAAGMPDLLFHDLRRSAVRNLVSAGVDERVAMMITGHRTRTVFDRYRIVDEDEISAALAKTEAATRAAQARTIIPLRAAEGKSAT